MKVTGWTNWIDERYIDIDDYCLDEDPEQSNRLFEEVRQSVIDELKEKKYIFTGTYHQNGDFGCPVLNNKFKFRVSMRSWGQIMVEAHNIQDKDGYAYCQWAWIKPDDQEERYPSEGDYYEIH